MEKATQTSTEVQMDRRSVKDRRTENDRRQKDVPVKVERRKLERRVKVSRRRQIDPTTCERDYSGDEIEFMQALDSYKRTSGRMFPTCSEILEVIRDLGYDKQRGSASESAEDSQSSGDSETSEADWDAAEADELSATEDLPKDPMES